MLTEADVGKGPNWKLAATECDDPEFFGEDMRMRCQMLLEQALSCSSHTDVRFIFDDGKSLVSGHWGMLCIVCKVFEVMHLCGMEESRTREIHIVGVSRESFRGFLEWLYLGYAGKEMQAADGREVWLLAERYQIEGIKEWLMDEGLDAGGLCAAAHYALEGDGEDRDQLLEACRDRAGSRYYSVDDGFLRGVSVCALREVLEGHRCNGDGMLEGERAMERFRLLQRWATANGVHGCDGKCDVDVCSLIDAIDLSRVPLEFIAKTVMPSGLVSSEHLQHIQLQQAGVVCLGDARLHHIKSIESAQHFTAAHSIAVSKDDDKQRLAVIDRQIASVFIYDIESGSFLMSVGTGGAGPGQFRHPCGVAFNKRGDLIVSDSYLDRVQVFDREGVHVRTFGTYGDGDGQFNRPMGIAVNDAGDIFVCDSEKGIVQMFREDGTFIRRAVDCDATGIYCDGDLSCVAVGPDGRIAIICSDCVRVYTMQGEHLLDIGSHKHETCYEWRSEVVIEPSDVCFGPCGEIVVCEKSRSVVKVFSPSGKLLQCIESYGDSDFRIVKCGGCTVDTHGRLFIGNQGNSDSLKPNVAMLGFKL